MSLNEWFWKYRYYKNNQIHQKLFKYINCLCLKNAIIIIIFFELYRIFIPESLITTFRKVSQRNTGKPVTAMRHYLFNYFFNYQFHKWYNVIMPPLRGYFLATAWRYIFAEGYSTKLHKDQTQICTSRLHFQHQRCDIRIENRLPPHQKKPRRGGIVF